MLYGNYYFQPSALDSYIIYLTTPCYCLGFCRWGQNKGIFLNEISSLSHLLSSFSLVEGETMQCRGEITPARKVLRLLIRSLSEQQVYFFTLITNFSFELSIFHITHPHRTVFSKLSCQMTRSNHTSFFCLTVWNKVLHLLLPVGDPWVSYSTSFLLIFLKLNPCLPVIQNDCDNERHTKLTLLLSQILLNLAISCDQIYKLDYTLIWEHRTTVLSSPAKTSVIICLT